MGSKFSGIPKVYFSFSDKIDSLAEQKKRKEKKKTKQNLGPVVEYNSDDDDFPFNF